VAEAEPLRPREAVIRDRTDRVIGGLAGVEALDPTQPQKALLAVGGPNAGAKVHGGLCQSARPQAGL